MKIAICEDENIFSSFLKNETINFFNNKGITPNIDIYTNGTELITQYQNGLIYDIIFMDIWLQSNDGVNIASQIRALDKKAIIIFVTSTDNRAIDGYDVNAFAYVLKSTFQKRFPETLERLWNELNRNNSLIINENGSTKLLTTDDILSIESSGRGSVIHTNEDIIATSDNITHLASKLPNHIFIECHKSVYVNISKIKRIDTNTLTLENNKSFPVSRRKRKDVMLAIMRRVGEQ